MMVIIVVSLQENNFYARCFSTLNVKLIKIIFKNSVPVSQKTNSVLGGPLWQKHQLTTQGYHSHRMKVSVVT
jgi:hypothetical protein